MTCLRRAPATWTLRAPKVRAMLLAMRKNAVVHVIVASALLLAAAQVGCSSCANKGSGAHALNRDLALMPDETVFVAMANYSRMRGTPVWTSVAKNFAWLEEVAAGKPGKDADIYKAMGVDISKQIDSVFGGLSQHPERGEFGILVRGGPFDGEKLAAYLKAQAWCSGQDIATDNYKGVPTLAVEVNPLFTFRYALLDKNTLIFAGEAWLKKIIDRAKGRGPGASSGAHEALQGVVNRARTDGVFWCAGLIPAELRTKLSAGPGWSPVASMTEIWVAADARSGVNASGGAALGNVADSFALTSTLNGHIETAKKDPQVLMGGWRPVLDAIRVAQEGTTAKVEVSFTQPQVDELLTRLEGLLRAGRK